LLFLLETLLDEETVQLKIRREKLAQVQREGEEKIAQARREQARREGEENIEKVQHELEELELRAAIKACSDRCESAKSALSFRSKIQSRDKWQCVVCSTKDNLSVAYIIGHSGWLQET